MSTETKSQKQKEPTVKTFGGSKFNRGVMLVIGIVVISTSFILVPVASSIGNDQNITFGSYAGRPIQWADGSYFSRIVDVLAQQYQDQQTSGEIDMHQIWSAAFQYTVNHYAILRMATDAGLTVSKARLDRYLVSDSGSPYVDENGFFDETVYQETSVTERADNRDTTRDQLISDTISNDFNQYAMPSTAETGFIGSMARQQRKFDYVVFDYTSFPDSEIAAYGAENADLFRRIQLSRITISSGLSNAESVLAQVRAGQRSFEDLAREYSQDPDAQSGGDMGWQYAYGLQNDFAQAADLETVFALARDATSDLVETDSGAWVIYKCNSPSQTPDFADPEVVSIVRDYMQVWDRGRIEDRLVEIAGTLRTEALASSLEEAAASRTLEIGTTEFFPISYGIRPATSYYDMGFSVILDPVTSSDQNPAFIYATFRENFFEQAFSLASGDISQPLVLDRYIVLLRLAEERQLSDSDISAKTEMLNYSVNILRQNAFQTWVVDPALLDDQFETTFTRVTTGTSSQQGANATGGSTGTDTTTQPAVTPEATTGTDGTASDTSATGTASDAGTDSNAASPEAPAATGGQ